MKTLLLVTDAWQPQVNGVVRVFSHLIPLLHEEGIEVTVVHPGLFKTVQLPLYPEIRLALFPGREIARALQTLKPDYIHIATEGPLGWSARRHCMLTGLRFTTSYHTHFQLHADARIPGLSRMVMPLLRRFHAPAASVFVVSEGLRVQLEGIGFRNLALWPLGVDANLMRPLTGKPPRELKKPVFLYFGRLAPEKSPREFFLLDLQGTKLVIGDGPSRTRLERAYPDAVFVGYQHGERLVEWLSSADVLVFPSRTETFGLVCLEALACGVPVAAHDVMGPRDIVTSGVDGYLGEDLRECALKCLTIDRSKCREKALQYSWHRSAKSFKANLVQAR